MGELVDCMANENITEVLAGLAVVSATLGGVLVKVAERTMDMLSKKGASDNQNHKGTTDETQPHHCKQEAIITGTSISLGAYGKRIESIEHELDNLRKVTREDGISNRDELQRLRFAISEVKDVVHSVELTITEVTTLLKLLKEG